MKTEEEIFNDLTKVFEAIQELENSTDSFAISEAIADSVAPLVLAAVKYIHDIEGPAGRSKYAIDDFKEALVNLAKPTHELADEKEEEEEDWDDDDYDDEGNEVW